MTERAEIHVRLGRLSRTGIAPTVYALVERGTARRPSPASRRGRSALTGVASGRVRIDGPRPLGRLLLRLLQI